MALPPYFPIDPHAVFPPDMRWYPGADVLSKTAYELLLPPLVHKVRQGVVNKPVLPDEASRAKLAERKSAKFTEQYEGYLRLGYLEWKKDFHELEPVGKKAVLFVMTDDTRNCDEVADFLGRRPGS